MTFTVEATIIYIDEKELRKSAVLKPIEDIIREDVVNRDLVNIADVLILKINNSYKVLKDRYW